MIHHLLVVVIVVAVAVIVVHLLLPDLDLSDIAVAVVAKIVSRALALLVAEVAIEVEAKATTGVANDVVSTNLQ